MGIRVRNEVELVIHMKRLQNGVVVTCGWDEAAFEAVMEKLYLTTGGVAAPIADVSSQVEKFLRTGWQIWFEQTQDG